MKRRIVVVLAAVLALSLVTGAATSEARGSGSVLPVPGRYLGSDSSHRHISFVLTSHGKITQFKVNGTLFPEASLAGSQWHHTCKNNLCTRGKWDTDFSVEGFWNNAASGGDVPFVAGLIEF
jgi:hypothetical protein